MAVGPFMLQRKIEEIINAQMYPLLKKFRPEEKHGLSEDMRNCMFDMQRAAVYYSADKSRRLAYLNKIESEMAVMRALIRRMVEQDAIQTIEGFCNENRLDPKNIPAGALGKMMHHEELQGKADEMLSLLDEIGRMCGGLRKGLNAPRIVKKNDEITGPVIELIAVVLPPILRNFPEAERFCLVRKIYRNLYDVLRYRRMYELTAQDDYLSMISAALWLGLEQIKTARRQHYVSGNTAGKIQRILSSAGSACSEERKKVSGRKA